MVCHDEIFHLIQRLKIFEDAVLEDGVELVLDARQHRVLLEDVEAELLKARIPVQLVQVEQLELVDNLAHAGLHFRLVQEGLLLQQVLLWQLLVHRFIPRIATGESEEESKEGVRRARSNSASR